MKLLMLSGLPASGKTTFAEKLVAQGNWVRVNRDLLREMLHFGVWKPRHEEVVINMEKSIAQQALAQEQNVVVDDCNLNPKNRDMWSNLAKVADATFETKHIDTDWQECLQRDAHREKKVGTHVIMGMAMQYDFYEPEKPLVIVDIDGTLADISHRKHFVEGVEKKDWKSFFAGMSEDAPRTDVFEQVLAYHKEGHPIILVSGRPENYRAQTAAWITKHAPLELRFLVLFMRRAGDSREDTIVKKEIYDSYLKNYPIEDVFDDRPSVIRMWREQGLPVIDCGDGIEF